MTDLMELASRVEAREGPDRDLDADIQDAVRLGGYKADRDGCSGRLCGTMTRMASDGDGVEWKPLPAFTASTEASGSLALKAWDHLEVYPPRGKHTGWTVHVIPLSRAMFDTSTGYAPSYERALTAAWLRARAHQGAAHVDQ